MAPSDKLERLMNLTAALLDADRPLTADDVGERVAGYAVGKEAFRRTFERDKEELRQLGVPITTALIPGRYPEEHGYRIDRSAYELPDPGLAPDELAALRLALQAVRMGEAEGGGTEALWKLGGAVDPGAEAGTGTADPEAAPGQAGGDPTGEGQRDLGAVASLPSDPSIVPLFGAVLERRVARFTYAGGAGEATRVVEPWRLEYRRGRWYLSAYDQDRRDERNYRLDRIRGTVDVDAPGSATAPAPDAPSEPDQPWHYGEGEAVTAVVRIEGDHARWAVDQLGTHTVTLVEPDGSTTFAVPVTSWPAFRSFVLSFLDHAEVLGPPDLRADMVAWLQAMDRPSAPAAGATGSS